MNSENIQLIPTNEESVQLVQQMYAALRSLNVPALLDFLSEDVEWSVAESPEEMPMAGTCYGRDRVAQLFELVDRSLELQQFEPKEFINRGDSIVSSGHARVRVRANNHSLEYQWLHVCTLREGKVVKFREYLDIVAIATACRSSETARVPAWGVAEEQPIPA